MGFQGTPGWECETPSRGGTTSVGNSPLDGEKHARLGQVLDTTSGGVGMVRRPRSQRQVQAQRSRELRAAGCTWAEVAADFGDEYRVNARVGLRLAHGWSQGDVADRWNAHWPDDPKTFKNISYWERWPAATGYEPSLEVLAKLAELYSCQLADLLADVADYRADDPVHRAREDLARLPAVIAVARESDPHPTSSDDAGGDRGALEALVERMEQSDVEDIAQQTALWANQVDPTVDRRSLLLKLGFALTLAAATPAGDNMRSIEDEVAFRGEVVDLSGIWRSEYSFYSTGRGQELASMHYVVVRQQGRSLAIESLPHSTGSGLTMSLSLDGVSATGSWEERTSPTGYYRGAVYRGAMQLLVAPSGRQLTGRWLGFGKNFQINNGDWGLTLESRSLSRESMHDYELKA